MRLNAVDATPYFTSLGCDCAGKRRNEATSRRLPQHVVQPPPSRDIEEPDPLRRHHQVPGQVAALGLVPQAAFSMPRWLRVVSKLNKCPATLDI
jgi:hypothetical protein